MNRDKFEEMFDFCDFFHEGYACVELNNKWNFINTKGELLSPNQWYDVCGDFSEGYAFIKLNNKFNYINTRGDILSPNQWFDCCDEFIWDGYAEVGINNKWKYISTKGNLFGTKEEAQADSQSGNNHLNESKIAELVTEEIKKSDVVDLIKKDKDFEKRVKEIAKDVIVELFRVLWQHNGIFKNLSK